MFRAVAALLPLLSATAFAQTPAAPIEPAKPAAEPAAEPATKPAAEPAKPAAEPAKPSDPPQDTTPTPPLAPAPPAAPAPAPAVAPPPPIAPAPPPPPAPAPAEAKAEPPKTPEPPAVAEPAGVDPLPEEEGFEEDAFEDEAAPPPPTYPWVEQHGYYRLRLDWLDDLHLSNYADSTNFVSGQAPPLTENVSNNTNERSGDAAFSATETSVSSANMRFRYQPTFHLAENVRIRTTLDILDNMVLGSTPDGLHSRNDVPMLAFSGGQQPPESMRNSLQDSVRVKHAWGEWKTPLGMLRVGRQPSHWGLGILANGGGCEDCDYGDINDRIMFVTKGLGTYIAFGYDIVASGATTATLAQSAGQDRDLDDTDDATQYILALFQRPLSPAEKQQRDYDLKRLRRPVLDFGLYGVYRQQENTSGIVQLDDTNDGRITDVQFEPSMGGPGTYDAVNGPHYVLYPREAKAWIPDLWAKFQWHPQRGHELRIEAELAAIIGELGAATPTPLFPAETTRREIMMWGGTVQGDYRMDNLRLGLEVGVASGGEVGGFGIYDGLAVPTTGDADITNFRFDRDYQVDLILFREIIGAVTNALYFKPTIEYDILRSIRSVLGLQLDVIYARALKAGKTAGDVPFGTPSGDPNYGVEFDTSLFFREQDRFSLQLSYGLFIPMDAFTLPAERNPLENASREAANSQTVQGRLVLKF